MGHSLGGGLAQTAAIALNLNSVTFNSAGPNSIVVNKLGGKWKDRNVGTHDAFRVKYEVLSSINGSCLYFTEDDSHLIGTPLSFGTPLWLDNVNGAWHTGTGHSMGTVLDSMESQLVNVTYLLRQMDRDGFTKQQMQTFAEMWYLDPSYGNKAETPPWMKGWPFESGKKK